MSKWKKLLGGALVLPLILACMQNPVPATATEEFSYKCGLEKGELIRDDNLQYGISVMSVSATEEETAYWTQFASDYYYNQLSEEKQRMWDELETQCIEVAVGTDDVPVVMVNAQGMSIDDRDEIFNFLNMFRYSNPQYYFLSNHSTYGYDYVGLSIGIRVYATFQDGGERSGYTKQFCEKVDEWVAEVKEGKRDEDKIKLAHDIITENTIYDDSLSGTYNQSAYSMVCEGETVCAGYAAALQLLLNPNGVQTAEVTSAAHGWNIVEAHGHWYVVDVTWDDQSPTIYSYYMKSDATVRSDSYGNVHHTPEAMWEGFLPDLKYDSTLSERYSYYSSYFEEDGFDYFKVNDNTERGELCVEVLSNVSDTAPGSVMHDGNKYDVLGILDRPGETEKPEETEKPSETEKPDETEKPNIPSVPTEGKFASYEGYDFFKDADGNITCYSSAGAPVKNDFKCDGIYTYYFQEDRTAMKDRLTYHPDGIHVIYFDPDGHEVFDNFAYVGYNIISMETGVAEPLKEYCYFNTYGYQYTNVITWGANGTDREGKLFYANEGGILERDGWFTFSTNATYAGDGSIWPGAGQRGYANAADCSLMRETWTYDENNLYRYINGYGVLE